LLLGLPNWAKDIVQRTVIQFALEIFCSLLLAVGFRDSQLRHVAKNLITNKVLRNLVDCIKKTIRNLNKISFWICPGSESSGGSSQWSLRVAWCCGCRS
jgi:hypothetical protein